MSSIIYKVIFKGEHISLENDLSLTFKIEDISKSLKIPANFFLDLKNLSKTTPHIITFKNIEEIVEISHSSISYSFNYYFIVLFSNKAAQEKEGYLFGNLEKVGDILIGIYPFNNQITSLTSEIFIEKINNLLNNPQDYRNICLIN